MIQLLSVATILGVSLFAGAAAGAPSLPEVLATRDLGPLETSTVISGRDGAYSTRVGMASVWVYGDTALRSPGADGKTWRHNTMSWTRDLYAADAIDGFSDWADTTGGPIEFIPLTASEIEYNRKHQGDNCEEPPCNYEYGIWPGAPIFDPDGRRVLYTYAKMLLGSGAWNFWTQGASLAVGSAAAGGPAERPVVNPGSSEPTLLFGKGEPVFINATFTERIGGVLYIYFYDCSGGSGFLKPMHVARAPAATALDRSTWRFYAGGGLWSPDVANMAMIFDGADQLSVHWNQFLGRYLAVYIRPLTQQAVGRVADLPEGPWSDAFDLFTALPPSEGGMTYCGMAHLEYQSDGGRFEYVSYVRDVAPFLSERRVVEVEFARRIADDERDADYDPQHGVMLSDASYPGQICMGIDAKLPRQMALQFWLNVPRPSTITTASVALVSSGQNAGSYTPVLRAIAQDDVAPFAAGSQPSFTEAYPLTQASVPWTPESAPAGAAVMTPELRTLFQEVIDRPGWRAGNALGLVFPDFSSGRKLRCYRDCSAGSSTAALVRIGYYPNGTPVCLDARGGEDHLLVSREPAGGCASAPQGPQREYVFGRIGALRLRGGSVDLGPVRCAGGASPTTQQIVRAADPDQPPADGAYYLCRPAGAADFGRARLPDGSTPARLPGPSFCP